MENTVCEVGLETLEPAILPEAVDTGWFIGARELIDRISPKHEDLKDVAEEAIGITATVGRCALTAFPMARRARNGESIFFHGAAAIIGDIGDGEVTRRISRRFLGREAEDTPTRRILDGILDQLTVLQVGYEVAKRNPSARPWLGLLALRSAVAGGGLNGIHLMATGEVTKGKNYQRACNLTAGIFGIAAASGNKKMTHATGFVAAATAWATAPKHLKEFREQRGRVFRELR